MQEENKNTESASAQIEAIMKKMSQMWYYKSAHLTNNILKFYLKTGLLLHYVKHKFIIWSDQNLVNSL